MAEEKRVSCRAIIFTEDKIVAMYRERDGRIFYTFPGGGMEKGETEEECVMREVFEEFGLVVKPLKKVYVYENERSLEHFYVCKWIAGEFGSGAGEEYQPNRKGGFYKQTKIEIANIPTLPLMPPEIAEAFVSDYAKRGQELTTRVRKINGHYNTGKK